MSINWPLAIGVILYNLIIVLAVGGWIKLRQKTHNQEEDFILSGRNLPWYVIAATNALTCIGGGHIMGLTGQSWATGLATVWFSISMNVSFLFIMMYVGPWFRRMGFVTVSGMFTALYGPIVRPLITAVSVGACFGVVTLETQGLGAVVSIVSGVPMWLGAVFGGIIGMLYILIAGTKEVGWVNLINATLMYIAVILTLIFLGARLPGGWKAVNDYYISTGQRHLLTLIGSNDIIRTYIVGTAVASLFYNPIVQQCAQVSASAKNSNHIKKAVLLAVPLNFMFSGFMVGLGMVAQTLPADIIVIPDGGPAMMMMIVHYLPTWLCIWIIGVFFAALLSTFAMLTLASAVHIVKDIAEEYFAKARFTLKQDGLYTRITVICFTVVCTSVAKLLPSVNAAIVWAFSWTTPMFVMFVVGMHYKRSTKACLTTWIIAWVLNMVLSVTPLMQVMHLEGNNHALYMFVVSLIFGYGLTALDKNAKPPFVKLYKERRAAYDAAKGAA